MLPVSAMESDDDKAFMLNLYNDYYGLVRKTIYGITRNTTEVEDLINDTFIKLIEKVSLLQTLDCCRLAPMLSILPRAWPSTS